MISGSLASALWGMVRTTQDSDIVTAMRLEHLRPFVSALKDEFYLDEQMIADAIRRHTCFNIIHFETIFKRCLIYWKRQWEIFNKVRPKFYLK